MYTNVCIVGNRGVSWGDWRGGVASPDSSARQTSECVAENADRQGNNVPHNDHFYWLGVGGRGVGVVMHCCERKKKKKADRHDFDSAITNTTKAHWKRRWASSVRVCGDNSGVMVTLIRLLLLSLFVCVFVSSFLTMTNVRLRCITNQQGQLFMICL